MWIVGIVLLMVIGIIIFVANRLTNIVISPPNNSISRALEQEIKQTYIIEGYYESLKKEDFKLTSQEGYNLKCQLIKNPMPSKKYIVFCHGYGFNRIGAVKYIDIFLREGFNIVLYDHRNSGESEGEYTTMGYFEKEDLKRVINYIYNRFGKDIVVGTHGESMGAATVLLHCSEDKRVKFVIADCPYSDLKKQLAYRLKIEHKLPQFPFLNIASIFSRIKAGFFFGQISPIKVIQQHNGLADVPIMFIHGDADQYIPPIMTEQMYQVKKGYKKLYLAKGADHAISVCVDRKRYESEVHDFLMHVDQL
ncbi:MAG TPA: alpha/beta hydrolase [Epulopiscium sp.]|nr:alpha/beta hydrolase [Candidatus Epulonipiscium sp.]